MIQPFQKDDALLADIEASRNATEGFRVWWLGQSGFLLQWQGKHLLFDPYLSDSLTKKYAQTAKPHTRMSERVIDPASLTMIDLVTSSHNHTDHLDAETLMPLLANNEGIQFVIPEANRAFVAERVQCAGHYPIGLDDEEVVEYKGLKITGIPAAHNTIDRDDNGRCRYMGFVVEFGEYAVYHSGDTLWYEGMEDILGEFEIDVAFLPINGNLPERGVAGNLNTTEAAQLGKAIGAKCVVPHHYDMFEFNTANPTDFVAACEQHKTPHKVLQIGERLDYE